MYVFHATPLCYLAITDRLALVSRLDERCCIPQEVYDQVVTAGAADGRPEARRLEQWIDAKRFDIVSMADTPLSNTLRENPNLSEADVAVLAYASWYDGTAVLDDEYGRSVADVERIETVDTAGLVLTAVLRGRLTPAAASKTIEALVERGWHCPPDQYSTLAQRLASIGR